MAAFSEVPPLHSSEAARLQSELQDLQRERRQAELKLRVVAPLRAYGPPGRGGIDRDARDRGGGTFDRDGGMGGRGWGGMQGRPGGDLRGELRRGGDLRNELNRGERGHRGEAVMMDREGRSGAGERPRAPHPWDPTPKTATAGGPMSGRVLIQSAITKRKGGKDDEAQNDDEDEGRRKKRGRGDDDDDDDDGDADDDESSKVEYSTMRMDKPSADLSQRATDSEPARKSRRIFAESDGDRDTDLRRDNDRDRGRRREGPSGRDREVRSPRDQRAAASDGDKEKERSEGASKVDVKSRNKRMFGGLLGHLQKAKKEEETISKSESIKKRQELQDAAEQKAAEMERQLREQSRAEQQKAREKARELRSENLARIRDIRAKQREALHSLALVRGRTQVDQLSGYIRTKAKPYIFWLPKSEKTGITTVTNPAVEPLLEETRKWLEEELSSTQARIEAQRAEDIAADAARQAAWEERQAARAQEAASRLEEDGGQDKEADAAGDEDGVGDEEEEEEPEEEIVL